MKNTHKNKKHDDDDKLYDETSNEEHIYHSCNNTLYIDMMLEVTTRVVDDCKHQEIKKLQMNPVDVAVVCLGFVACV